jgi:hypothetical protein
VAGIFQRSDQSSWNHDHHVKIKYDGLNGGAMLEKRVLLFLLSIFFATTGFSQSVLKTFIIAQNPENNAAIVRNESRKEWLVTWVRADRTDLFGRLVKSDGHFRSKIKVLSRDVRSFGGAYNFGVAFNSVDRTYLVVYRNTQSGGLQAQFFTENLAPKGRPFFIAYPNPSYPAVTYNSIDNTFLVAWLKEELIFPVFSFTYPSLISVTLDSNGNPVGSIRELAKAATGSFRGGVTLSRNEAENRSMVIVADDSKLLGYHIRSDGTLLRATPTVLQHQTFSGRASFSADGTGFAAFIRNGSHFKLRKISPAGFAQATRGISKSSQNTEALPALIFDPVNNQYFSAWLSSNDQLVGGLHNPATGFLKTKPFLIADFSSGSFLASSSISASYDSTAANALVVWAESGSPGSTGSNRLRATVVKLN